MGELTNVLRLLPDLLHQCSATLDRFWRMLREGYPRVRDGSLGARAVDLYMLTWKVKSYVCAIQLIFDIADE